ncbi:N-acetylmuramoyl-L-alanine amidase, partial [Candidatus Sumerlaeota bacterium]|nr:N-acetylmuramoyl-L-alanine amidase [Candidatus Sumerlaeota bacterium]
ISKDLPSGWKIEWDDTFGILRFTAENSSYALFLDKKTFLIDGEINQAKEPIAKKDGKIFVPVSSLELMKNLFREVSLQEKPEIKPTPTAAQTQMPSLPEKTPSTVIQSPEPAPPAPSGVFRIMIDPASEPLKWEAPRESKAPLPKQEVVTLEIALGIKKILEQEKGVEVMISNRKGETLSPDEKIARINTSGADVLVSLRLNASRFERLEGVDVYVCSDAIDPEAADRKMRDVKSVLPLTLAYLPHQQGSLTLADSLYLELSSALSCRVGPITPAPLYLLKRTAKPAVLVSCGYVSNPRETSLLTKDAYLETLARAIANGILRYKNQVINKNS